MANAALGGVLWPLCQAAPGSDGELLDRFRTDRDEAAFATLVRRHGPMVLGVCRRTLRNEADAEDAFQATFLVLARRAHAVSPAGRVGHWLYGVAFNTARKARTMNRRRLARERIAGEARLSQGETQVRSELSEAIDVELNRLPDSFRAAVIACDLEGEPIHVAARRLGCPPGTVASRLARGRQMLKRNLARRGLGVAALLTPGLATAAVPARLAMLTIRAATGAVPAAEPVLALTQGVIHAMYLTKIRFALAAVVAAGVLAAGVGGSTLFGAGQEKPAAPPKTEKPLKPGVDPAKPGEKPAQPTGDVKKAAGFAGTVKSVDADKHSITLTTLKGEKAERTIAVAADAAVSIDGRPAKLGDVKAGMHANVKFAADNTTAAAIGCDGPTLVGELKQLAADQKSVKLVVQVPTDPNDKNSPKKAEEKTIAVGEDLRLSLDGSKKVTVLDLKVGSNYVVQMSADGGRAISIATPKPEPALTGELKAADGKSITVSVVVLGVKGDKSSAKTEDRTMPLAENVRISVDGNKLSTTADLKPGAHVAVFLTKEGDKVVGITATTKGAGVQKPAKPAKQ